LKPAHVAIVGGGFSGTLQAIQLLRHGTPRVTLIERAEKPALGAAYSTRHAEHLLNVRASGMSAFADAPAHFAEWFGGRGGAPAGFAQRCLYGAYLEELLGAAREAAGERLELLRDEVTGIDRTGDGELLQLRNGGVLAADAVVLAMGNLPPDVPLAIASAGLADGVYVADPWASDFAAGLERDEAVLLIGTGLTAVDAVLMLGAARFGGNVLALSRRGLLPRAHKEPQPVPPLDQAPPQTCAALLRALRSNGQKIGWRAAVDQLRPVTQALWQRADIAERRRFLRHLRPWWDVHRHRIAPEIAGSIQAMIESGRVEAAAGKIVAVQSAGQGVNVVWRPRGAAATRELRVSRIVNCTGPQADISRAGEPLLDQLIASRKIRPDPCRIGIDVDPLCRVIDAAGAPSTSLFAVGPMTRGAFWEIVAVPDIRVQVEALASRLNHDPE
jgi:uncharacterized NAD(P)/FAD-binding protein YdhS